MSAVVKGQAIPAVGGEGATQATFQPPGVSLMDNTLCAPRGPAAAWCERRRQAAGDQAELRAPGAGTALPAPAQTLLRWVLCFLPVLVLISTSGNQDARSYPGAKYFGTDLQKHSTDFTALIC